MSNSFPIHLLSYEQWDDVQVTINNDSDYVTYDPGQDLSMCVEIGPVVQNYYEDD